MSDAPETVPLPVERRPSLAQQQVRMHSLMEIVAIALALALNAYGISVTNVLFGYLFVRLLIVFGRLVGDVIERRRGPEFINLGLTFEATYAAPSRAEPPPEPKH